MAKDLCVNGVLNDAKYSSPMPMIGLYIAGATLVCFLSMVCDILYGIRRRKQWLPCRFFSLNSLTLTLLSIATKLPVDLTTPMPRSEDQLSKLSGTALICISMGFFMPSLGIMRDSEGFANMASLTILVVAVVVNVCIQMATGVIFSFIVEHVIILCCMLTLLMVLWSSMSTINVEKTICNDRTRELLLKGGTQGQSSNNCMIQRLKLCYVHSYSSNPQLILFQTSHCAIFGTLCTLCSVVLLEAVYRSFVLKELKFCKKVSDYGWSMKIVVLTQILNVLVGSVATSFRCLTFASHLDMSNKKTDSNKFSTIIAHVFSRRLGYDILTWSRHYIAIKTSKMNFMKILRSLKVLVRFVVLLMQIVLFVTNGLVVFLCLIVMLSYSIVRKIFALAQRDGGDMNSKTEEFQDVFYSAEQGLKEWILRIGVEDMERWMKVNKKKVSPNHLFELLLKTPPSELSLANDIQRVGQGCSPDELVKYFFGGSYSYRVSSLSIVILVLVTRILIPSTLSRSLIHTFDEVFEIIYFIDNKMNAASLGNKLTWTLTEDVWRDKDIIIHWFQKEISNMVSNEVSQPQTDLDRVLGIIDTLRADYKFNLVDPEVRIILDFIMNQNFTSVKELYNYIEQLFVDMLHSFLISLPCAIVKDIVESPAEECEERVRLGMKFLCKLELLEDKIKWLFPERTNITSLLTIQAPTTDTHHSTQIESGDAIVPLDVNENDGGNIPTTHDEIIQDIV